MPDRASARLILLLILLTACTPRDLLLGSGAAVGTAAMQERGIDGAASDYSLRLTISESWFHHSVELFRNCSLMISRQRVVIIGRVPTEEMKQLAETLARKAGAVQLANRITVGPPISVGQRVNDAAASARLDATLTFDRDVSALNYDVETRNSIVYLIGEAASERERRRVHYLASLTPGVSRVESFIQVAESSE